MKTDREQKEEAMMAKNVLTWAHLRKLNLRDGIKFSLKGRPYLTGIVNYPKRILNIKKGTQIGATTTKYLEAVHGCLYKKYDQNIMYMMPTVKAVESLARVSFDPIFDYNLWLKKHVTTNTASTKEINGRSIVFVGAQPQKIGGTTKDSANLRSIPCDVIKRDEIDLMDPDMVEKSKERLNNSKFRIEENYGSPTFPGYGIDELYENSDQNKWQILCKACGKYTALCDSWKTCIIKINGRWIRACKNCHAEIFVQDGDWEPEYKDRREGGVWIDGWLSPMADLEGYMYRYEHAEGVKLSEFLRSIIGEAASEKEMQLTREDVIGQCNPSYGSQVYSSGETAMGIDVGRTLHCVVGNRTGQETYELLQLARIQTFNDALDIVTKMKVKNCVVDALPDIHAARDFQKNARQLGCRVILCQYSEQMPGTPNWTKDGLVKVNRNEWCDKVNDIFINKKMALPRQSEEIEEYAKEMTKTAKTLIPHPETGIQKPRWIKLSGDDHYYHTTLYFLLAASRTSPRRNVTERKNTNITTQRSNSGRCVRRRAG